MDLRQIGLRFRHELQFNFTQQKALEIADKIDTMPISEEDKEHILNYIRYFWYDHVTGRKLTSESDSVKLLYYVTLMSKRIKKDK